MNYEVIKAEFGFSMCRPRLAFWHAKGGPCDGHIVCVLHLTAS